MRLLNAVEWPEARRFYSDQRKLLPRFARASRQLIPTSVAISITLEFLEGLTLLAVMSVKKDKSHSPSISACTTIAAHMTSDAAAIKSLCSHGFDVQARALLRGYIEKGDLLLAVLNDDELANEYLVSSTFAGSRDFFFRRISKGKLAKLARQSFKDKTSGLTIDEWLWGEWRETIELMVNAAIHPNHAVSMISLFPNLGRGGGSRAIGLRGHPNHNSVRTLRELMIATMPVALVYLTDPIFPADGTAGDQMIDEAYTTREKILRAAKFTLSFCIADSNP